MQIGLISGSFDIIQPDNIYTFRKAKQYCDYLVIALKLDPIVEQADKSKLIFSCDERQEMLLSIRYIDEVIKYTTEEDFLNILKTRQFNVRIVNDEFIEKRVVGQEYSDQIIYIQR